MRKSGRFLIVMVVTITITSLTSLLLTGCENPQRLDLNASGTIKLRAGEQFQFSALLNGGVPDSGIIWTLLQVGSSTQQPGTITKEGLYTAPSELTAPVSAQIIATLGPNGTASATATVEVLPLPPVIATASPNLLLGNSVTVEIGGAHFIPKSLAFVNGAPADFQYETASTASISISLGPGATQASITMKNPWDSTTSAPLVIPVNITPMNVPGHVSHSSADMSEELGCANPNTGDPTNDWGTGTDPLYVQPTSLSLGNPTYLTNTIFWTSIETAPGQSVLLTGAFTSSPKTVRIAAIPPGTDDWQSLVRDSLTVVKAQQQSSSALYFTIPQSLPPGIYGFEIIDPTAPAIMGLANVPSIEWLIGVPTDTKVQQALQHSIHDCGAEPGETLRIFGNNFTPSMQITLISSEGAPTQLTPVAEDSDSISVVIPSTMQPGPYSVQVGNAGSSDLNAIKPIYLFHAPAYSVVRSSCNSLVGDGKTDDTSRLQSCLDANAPPVGSARLSYIDIPSGDFVITGTVRPHSGEVLIGAGENATRIDCQPGADVPTTWFAVPNYVGISSLSISGPVRPYLISSTDHSGNPVASGHIYLSNVQLEATSDLSDGKENMVYIGGPDVQIYHSEFKNDSFLGLLLLFGDGAIVSDNHFIINDGWMEVENSQNVIFEHNSISSTKPYGSANLSGGLSISRGMSQFAPSAISQNVYVGYNTFENLGASNQQIILNDGGGGAYYGKLASSTAGSVTLADPPAWNWMGTSNPQASLITIVSGTGVGEHSLISSYSGRTIHLLHPWKVIPDNTSLVVIAQYDRNMTYAHNVITDTMGVSLLLTNMIHGLIEDNVLTNSGRGILINGFGPYGGPAAYSPVLDTSVLRNTVLVGKGDRIQYYHGNYNGGIGIADMPGILVSGVLIRENKVANGCTIYVTNGWNQLSGVLVEQNQANLDLAPYGKIRGISEIDNSPQ